jgi:polyisoprenoid-binding protein YceI
MLSNLSFPVASLKTGLEMRDRHLQEIIAADRFPEISLALSSSDSECNPSTLEKVDQCELLQKGQISIRGITRELTLKSIIKKDKNSYIAKGSIVFPWAAFEIEDPSNLFAKLKPEVTVFYSMNISQ